METDKGTARNIDQYIAHFPPDVREKLAKIREAIRQAAPDAEETISYKMPSFVLKGTLVYFAAFKKHIGFYPRTTAITKFRKELAPYGGAKGSVRFPLDKPIPTQLIRRIVKFRAAENRQRAKAKTKK
jgi:uncharacterized protein YdhG (YjbR/CyaY superfamily)